MSYFEGLALMQETYAVGFHLTIPFFSSYSTLGQSLKVNLGIQLAEHLQTTFHSCYCTDGIRAMKDKRETAS